MTEHFDGRGVLFPARLPSFHRVPVSDPVSALVHWFWIPRWRLAPGTSSRQEVLPFPASNLVIEPDGVSLVGPTTGASHRVLTGEGWAVGALLRPAALATLVADPREIRNTARPCAEPDLHRAVTAAMHDANEPRAREEAVRLFTEWVLTHLPAPDDRGLLANRMETLIASDRSVVRLSQVAERLGVSIRAAQRLAERYVGLPPLAIIRRYRLQEAAERVRADPDLSIAQIAAELGYADHAHLTADFRHVLGFTPTSYRRT